MRRVLGYTAALTFFLLVVLCAISRAGSIQIDSATRADVSSHGTWKITSGSTVVVADLAIGVWDQEGNFTAQADGSAAKVELDAGRCRLSGTLGEKILSYEADVSRCRRGIHFRWSQVGSAQHTWAVIMKLPRALFAGTDFILDGQQVRTFPSEVPPAPRFFSGNAESLLTARAKGNRLLMDYGRQHGVVVQDARKWGGDSYHVLVYPKKGEVSFLLSLSSVTGGPEILSVSRNRDSVGTFEKFELTADVWARFANPYDERDINVSAEFSQPSGRTVRIDGFIYREYLREIEGDKERFEPAGRPVWKVRFSPTETGRHFYSMTVITKRGASATVKGEFESVSSKLPGFVRVAPSGTHFEFTNGSPYFAVGHNVCWTSNDSPIGDYESYFEKMSNAGENFTRIWLCSWGIGLETDALNRFDLEDAWKMDYVLALAEKRGIFLKLCFENFWDFTKKKKSPYWTENGGFCSNGEDFFAKTQAREWAKRKYRYAVSRWGYSPNILAWELWNEMDYAVSDESLMLEWTREMATFLRLIDPFDHMITTSLGLGNVLPALWSMPEMDFVQIHTYIRRLGGLLSRRELDASAYVRREVARMSGFGKPYLMSEFGYMATNEDPGMNAVDTLGIHLHNALWTSVFSGASGTCVPWWWDSYIDKNDLYYHFEHLSKFLQGEEQWLTSLEPVAGEGRNFRVLGLRGDEGGLFWMQNRNNTWYRCAAKRGRFMPLKGAVLKLSRLTPGRYAVEWWDTYNGGIITRYETEVTKGVLTARPPASASDVGCKVKLLE